jgi:hypothetical protein
MFLSTWEAFEPSRSGHTEGRQGRRLNMLYHAREADQNNDFTRQTDRQARVVPNVIHLFQTSFDGVPPIAPG